jgi:hypothetical protein
MPSQDTTKPKSDSFSHLLLLASYSFTKVKAGRTTQQLKQEKHVPLPSVVVTRSLHFGQCQFALIGSAQLLILVNKSVKSSLLKGSPLGKGSDSPHNSKGFFGLDTSSTSINLTVI